MNNSSMKIGKSTAVLIILGGAAVFGTISRIAHPVPAVASTASDHIGIASPCALVCQFPKASAGCTEQPSGRPTYKLIRRLRSGSVELLKTEVVYQLPVSEVQQRFFAYTDAITAARRMHIDPKTIPLPSKR